MSEEGETKNAQSETKNICACTLGPPECPNEVEHADEICRWCITGIHPHLPA